MTDGAERSADSATFETTPESNIANPSMSRLVRDASVPTVFAGMVDVPSVVVAAGVQLLLRKAAL